MNSGTGTIQFSSNIIAVTVTPQSAGATVSGTLQLNAVGSFLFVGIWSGNLRMTGPIGSSVGGNMQLNLGVGTASLTLENMIVTSTFLFGNGVSTTLLFEGVCTVSSTTGNPVFKMTQPIYVADGGTLTISNGAIMMPRITFDEATVTIAASYVCACLIPSLLEHKCLNDRCVSCIVVFVQVAYNIYISRNDGCSQYFEL